MCRFLLIVVLCLSLACTGCNSRETSFNHLNESVPEHIFRYAENQAADYPTTLGAYRFAELVCEKTDGRIKIIVYHSAQLGSEVEVLEQLRFGGIDFARVSLSCLTEMSPEFSVLQLPYLYSDDAHMWRVLDGDIGKHYLTRVEEFDLSGLSWYNAGARSFYTRVHVRAPKDLQGLDIRIQESKMMADMVKLLGANPVQMTFEEVYSNLQLGKVDGAENNWPSYESTSHYEVAQYFYLDEHTRIPEMQLMSKISMDKLSKEDRKIIQECARESALFEREEWNKREKLSEETVRASGVEVVTLSIEEKQELQNICMPLYEKYAMDYMDVVGRILALKESD